jgi:cyclopropane fatty-acyl-phospholipid synthase-like methyltransferase
MDYAWTLRQWRDNLTKNTEMLTRKFGKRMLRKFICYVALCEAGFVSGRTSVSQFAFVRA